MDWIERLRRKPPYVKAQVAFGAALSVTLVIALVWGLTLPMRLSAPSATQDAATTKADSGSSFMSEVKRTFGGVAGTLRDALTAGGTEDEVASASSAASTTQNGGDTLDLDAARKDGETAAEVERGQATDQNTASNTSTSSGETLDTSGTTATGSSGIRGSDEAEPRRPRVILIGTTSTERSDETSE